MWLKLSIRLAFSILLNFMKQPLEHEHEALVPLAGAVVPSVLVCRPLPLTVLLLRQFFSKFRDVQAVF